MELRAHILSPVLIDSLIVCFIIEKCALDCSRLLLLIVASVS